MQHTSSVPLRVSQRPEHSVVDLPQIHVVVHVLVEPLVALPVESHQWLQLWLDRDTSQADLRRILIDVHLSEVEVRIDGFILVHGDRVETFILGVEKVSRFLSKEDANVSEPEELLETLLYFVLKVA